MPFPALEHGCLMVAAMSIDIDTQYLSAIVEADISRNDGVAYDDPLHTEYIQCLFNF